MAYLIDTSVFITLERRGEPLNTLRRVIADEPPALAAITASELLAGVYRTQTQEQRTRRNAAVEEVLSEIPVLPFDLEVARVHAEAGANLARTGLPIGAHDLIIAATALAHDYAIVTENTRHFNQVPGLTVRQPNW